MVAMLVLRDALEGQDSSIGPEFRRVRRWDCGLEVPVWGGASDDEGTIVHAKCI